MPKSDADMRMHVSANDRFKSSWDRMLGAGMLAAVVLEIVVVTTWPGFHVSVDYRMVVVADTLQQVAWAGRNPEAGEGAGVLAPRITNLEVVQHALPRSYPPLAWEIRLENAITLRLRIDEDGKVRNIRIVEAGADVGADEAMARLATLLRFTPATVDGAPVSVTAFLRLAVETPEVARARGWVDRGK